MSDLRRAHCMPSRGGCGRHRSEVGEISWRGLCAACGHAKLDANVDGIHFRTGPAYERWLLGIAERAVSELGALQSLGLAEREQAD